MQISDVKHILEETLKHLTIEVKRIEVIAGEPHPFLSITTADSGMLIGVHGENLHALNYLLKRIVESKTDDSVVAPSFLVDVNGYHRRRINEIKRQAQLLADRARTFKSDVAMDPLNSYERMIIHANFVNDPDIYTESTGMGKGRRIVFKYNEPKEKTLSSDRELFAKEETN